MKKFTIALDADDVLAPCIEPGCKELGIDPRRITDWKPNKTDLTTQEKAAFLEVVCSPAFVGAQKPYPGGSGTDRVTQRGWPYKALRADEKTL